MSIRKILILFFLLLAISESFAQGGWVLRKSGTEKRLNSISSADGWFVVAVGDSGTVVNSGTAGVTWEVQERIGWIPNSFNGNRNLYGVCAISSNIFCAAGLIDSIFRSVDRGKTWVGIRSHAKGDCKVSGVIQSGAGAFLAIDYDSSSHLCVAVGDVAEATFSLDSGKHWLENLPNTYWTLDCVSAYKGSVLASSDDGLFPGHTFLTKDQGDYWDNAWIQKNIPIFGCSLLGWTLVGQGGAVYHTLDKGFNWDTVQVPTIQNFNAVHFATNAIGYMVGDSGLIFFTTDGGYNWQRQYSPTTKNLRSVHMTDAFHGFICGDSGVILTTTNGGYTADAVNPAPSGNPYSLTSYPNPAKSRTRVEIEIPNRGHVRLRIYNLLGVEIATLADADYEAGHQNFEWLADGFASGVYICKMEVDGRIVVSEITITK